ncbi:MAG: hypothetical protein HC905_14160 [Bacteroidales bacterium]|nr:hypothetical protein [Bacteroidales bacterium]
MKRFQSIVKGNEDQDKIEEGEETKSSYKSKFYLTYYNVFNVSQCEGLDSNFFVPYKVESNFWPIDNAEDIMSSCGANINFSDQDKAFYSPIRDFISLPQRKQFKNITGFYHTVFHEVGHWTGHPERLNRKLFNMFGTPDYAREELTAEMSSVFVCSLCGIDVKLKNSAAYIDNWLSVIRNDKTAFVRASMQAQTAANYILDCAEMQHLKRQPEEEKKEEKEQAAA